MLEFGINVYLKFYDIFYSPEFCLKLVEKPEIVIFYFCISVTSFFFDSGNCFTEVMEKINWHVNQVPHSFIIALGAINVAIVLHQYFLFHFSSYEGQMFYMCHNTGLYNY